MKLVILFFGWTLLLSPGIAQESAEDYGLLIFNMITTGNSDLNEQFIDLNQYSAYIDNLKVLEEHEKENMKYGAEQNYSDIRHDFDSECTRILELYKEGKLSGITFSFELCEFEPNKNFPNLGIVTCYYIADIPEEEEPVRDAILFECVQTQNGWRILDGFFDETYANQ